MAEVEVDILEEMEKVQGLVDELFEAGRDDCAAEIQGSWRVYPSSPSPGL